MKKMVNLRKIGKFYHAYEDDAYVLHYCLGYNVCNGKVGFPVSALGKVQSKLEEYKVNYQIFDKDNVIDKKDFKNNNKYEKCYKEGLKSVDRIKSDEELIQKIHNLSDEKVNKILKYIEEVLNEE